MIEHLFKKVCESEDLYISIIERKENTLSVIVKRIYIYFTRFNCNKIESDRYVNSRYYLIRLAKRIGIYNNFNYCFSHAGKYSAVLVSSKLDHMSVDIEPINRHLTGSLRLRIRELFPCLKIPEIMVILILESLVKLTIFYPSVNLSKILTNFQAINITELRESVFEVSVNNVMVFSKIYTYSGLYICITLQTKQFDLIL